jgi:predicted ATP-dependent serine protease
MSTPHRLRPIPLSQALQQTSTRLSTGIQSLDDVLGGGLKTGQVTEITGPPGVGKTRFMYVSSPVSAVPIAPHLMP